MSTKWTLDMAAMQEEFFCDSALIGIVSALQGYKLCWMLNRHLDTNFIREPDLDVLVLKNDSKQHYFPIFQYSLPLTGDRHLIYKLKNDKETLLPEVKQLDYLWLVQCCDANYNAQQIAVQLRNISDIQLAQLLDLDKIKNLNNLLV